MGPTHAELRRAEEVLRRDDKAIRLRRSLEKTDTILLERKTFRGRIGSTGPGFIEWMPDAGYRREWGLVPVAAMPASTFSVSALQASLRASDTWRQDPLWRRVEEAESAKKARVVKARKEGMRYKAGELWEDYAWRTRSRISVPGAIA